MRRLTTSLTVDEFGRASLNLGRADENAAVRVEIDLSAILVQEPSASAHLTVESPVGAKYPASTVMDGGKLIWDVSDADTAAEGTGRAQLTVTGPGGEVLKSAVAVTRVGHSLRGEGEAPEPLKSWVDDAVAKLAAVESAIADAQQVADDIRQKLEAGAFVGPKGDKGDKGNKGDKGDKGDTGEDGLSAPQIDDTAVTATNPWSSQHIVDTLCPEFSVSGNPAVCYPVAGSKLGVTASWEPTQEGTGTPSPDNIRPIHGRTQVKVERCGENLLNIAPFTKRTNKGITYEYVANGGIHIYGTATDNSDGPTFVVGHLPPGKYYGIETGTGVYTSIVVKRNGKNLWLNANGVLEILAGDTIKYWYVNVSNGITLNITIYPYIVSGTSAPATHTPYIGSTTTITLPSTIYGGEVGADGDGQETWEYIESYAGEVVPAGWICDRAVYAEGATPPTGAQVAYKLTTPIPFTATGGGTIKALPGTNTVLTDTDTLTITGRADPIHIINVLTNRVAALENAAANE